MSLGAVANVYGYTQDHAAWLARTGRVEACQVGNRRQWFVREASLRKYKQEIDATIAHGYIPLRMAARQYGYAKDYIGALARSGKIDAQQDAAGRWFVRESAIKNYKDESSQRRAFTPAPVAHVASITLPRLQPVATYASESEQIPVVGVNRKRMALYIAVLILAGTSYLLRHQVTNFALDIMRGFGSEGQVALSTPTSTPVIASPTSTPSATPVIASPSPTASSTPSPAVVGPVIQRITITNPPTQSEVLSALEAYFRQGLPPQIVAQLKGEKGDAGAPGAPGISAPTGFSIGSVPNTNGQGAGTIGGITYFGAKDITTENLTVSGNTTLASLVADSGTFNTFTATNATFGATTLSSLAVSGQTSLSAASVSANLEVNGAASASELFGANLSTCDPTTQKLLWANGTFSCGTDRFGSGGGGGSAIGLREGFTGGFTDKTSTSFDAGAFNLDFSNDDARVSLDYVNGPASRAMANTWTALNIFGAGASVSGVLDVTGTLKVGGLIQANGGEGVSYSRIGSNTTSHGLGTSNDLLITGSLEVDGSVYSDGEFIANTGTFNNIEGGGLVACDGTNDKLQYDFLSKLFSCGTDQTGGTGTGGIGSIAVREGSGVFTHITSISFNAGAFNISNLASESVVKLDYTNGPASRSIAQTITGAWSFTAASNQFSNTLEIKTASISALSIAGSAFNPSSYLLLFGGTLTGNLFGVNASFSDTVEALTGKFTTITNDAQKLSFVGNASFSQNLEVSGTASSSKLFGSGLSACTGKLLWSAGLFSCGVDQTNTGTLTAIAVREGSGTFAHITSISFDADVLAR